MFAHNPIISLISNHNERAEDFLERIQIATRNAYDLILLLTHLLERRGSGSMPSYGLVNKRLNG